MNQFFLYWVDLVAMLLSIALSVVLTVKAVRKNLLPIRRVAAFFLFFGPTVIAVHMSFHLTEVLYRASIAASEGTFAYTFRFYSLQLMGVVLTYLSITLLSKAFAKCQHRHFKNRELFKTMFLIVLVSAPTIPFTPIGSLPTLACLICSAALPFVHKRKVIEQQIAAKVTLSAERVRQII